MKPMGRLGGGAEQTSEPLAWLGKGVGPRRADAQPWKQRDGDAKTARPYAGAAVIQGADSGP